MPRMDKSKSKQRKIEDIAADYEQRGVSARAARRSARESVEADIGNGDQPSSEPFRKSRQQHGRTRRARKLGSSK